MRKKLNLFFSTLALAAGTLIQAGTAQAQCWWGAISPSAHDTSIVSSNVFGGTFAFHGQNLGTWANGGYPMAWAQRWDTAAGSVTVGVHGGAYTTQIQSNGTYVSIPKYFSNLQHGTIHNIYPDGGNRISAIQVQVWYCQ